MDRYIGRLLDNRYEILEVIGTGGMAVVYKARCHRLNRLVAIKILKDEYSQDTEFRRRFHAESQAVAMLSHPNIVQVYDVSSTGEADYIVMELIDGITLKQYMEKKGVLNWKETLHFGMQIASALDHAHSRGIVHRDIKPHNVMVLKNGSVKVADFGIAQVMSTANTLTKEALGSVHYISPEQAKGGRVDNRSDIYSLGVVMYEMITGRPPYDGETPVAIAIKHINGGAVKPSVWNPNIPTGLEQIIQKAMAHDVGDRYESAGAMLGDMEQFRKEPSMLFGMESPQAGKKTAEGSGISTAAVAAAAPVAGNRQTSASARSRELAAQRARQRQLREERQSRTATVAIVACSLVAVLAIVIFLVTLARGSLFPEEPAKVLVPNLVDKNYTEIPTYEGLTIVLKDREYNDTFEKGRIFNQEPEAGAQVVQGTQVLIWISMGPEPKEKTMESLKGLTPEQGQSFLEAMKLELKIEFKEEDAGADNSGFIIRTSPEEGKPLTQGQTVTIWVGSTVKRMASLVDMTQKNAERYLDGLGLGLTWLIREENSEDVEEGLVIRTEPAAGEEIREGETVTLWISTGSAVVKNKMPRVVGMKVDNAVDTLRGFGFKNVTVEEVESTEENGVVLEQNYESGAELDVTTLIKLLVSRQITTEPTTPPTENTKPTESTPSDPSEATPVTVNVEVQLPDSKSDFVLSICQNGKKATEDIAVTAGTRSVSVNLTGTGTQNYDLLINGELYNTMIVNFSANG